MLVKGQTATIKLTKGNRDRYEKLGYLITDIPIEITIKAEHLPKSSPLVLDFSCDECGQVYQKQFRSVHKLKRDLCEKCRVEQANSEFNKHKKVIKVFGRTEFDCQLKVLRERKKGYKRCIDIQKSEGVIDKDTGLVQTYYYTIMKLAE